MHLMTAQTPIYLLDDDPFVLDLLAEGFHTLGRVFPSASWTEPVIELGSPEGVRVLDPVSRPRLACAARYESYSRERETPGQGVFLNPQGYPPNFSSIPRNWSVVHLPYTTSCTALSPARRETSG